MKTLLRRILIAGAAVFVALQIAPVFPRTNPAAAATSGIHNQVEVPAEMDAILRRACWNCHSNDTKWPWYGYVAPASWLIARDVDKAREIMNFSVWTEQAGKKLQMAVGMLAASCADVNIGRMPKPEYVFLHSEAMLTEADKQGFCEWTKREGKRLLVLKRKQAAASAP
ncbi:MAG: heme-binding domain-containing protein [Bryobacterales bacterium]|nr:heme-binding domain-containing protein [Bryobacterales bacterium]